MFVAKDSNDFELALQVLIIIFENHYANDGIVVVADKYNDSLFGRIISSPVSLRPVPSPFL